MQFRRHYDLLQLLHRHTQNSKEIAYKKIFLIYINSMQLVNKFAINLNDRYQEIKRVRFNIGKFF